MVQSAYTCCDHQPIVPTGAALHMQSNPQPRKKKGVFIPLPIFIVLAIILFFETTLLFAYTIIALDNNLGSGLFPIGSTRINACPEQQAINVAPKFFVGSVQSEAQLPEKAPTTVTSTTVSVSTTTKPAGTAHTTVVTTVSPTPVTVSSVVNLTVDPNGSTITPTKTTSFTTVPAKSGNARKRASLESKLKDIAKSADGGKDAPTPTTLVTGTTATEDAKATSSAAGGGAACFGGTGAVGLVCPGGVGTDN